MNGQDGVKLQLDGDLTLPQSDAIRASLLNALEQSTALEVKFGSVGSVDLSFVQLMASLARTAAAWGRTVTFGTPLPPSILEVARRAGFLDTASEDSAPEAIFPAR